MNFFYAHLFMPLIYIFITVVGIFLILWLVKKKRDGTDQEFKDAQKLAKKVAILLFVILILGKCYSWYKVAEIKSETVKTAEWYKSLEVMPPQREDLDVRDSTYQKCVDFVDTETRHEMTCFNKWGTDIFRWDKTSELRGKFWRKEAKDKVYGTYTIHQDNAVTYLGYEKTGSGKESVFRVFKCSDCG